MARLNPVSEKTIKQQKSLRIANKLHRYDVDRSFPFS